MHTKYYNEENQEVPSVTTVLKVLNKPSLVGWANSLGFKRVSYNKELNRTAVVGTLVHAYIEEKFKKKAFRDIKKAYELEYNSTTEVLNSYFAFKRWYSEVKKDLNVLGNEVQISGDEFGGTIDMIAELEGETYIIDFKTSSRVHPTMFLQLSAYIKLAEKEGYNIDKVAILRLDKKSGKYQFVTMSKHKCKRYFKIFQLLLQIYIGWSEITEEDWNISKVFE